MVLPDVSRVPSPVCGTTDIVAMVLLPHVATQHSSWQAAAWLQLLPKPGDSKLFQTSQKTWLASINLTTSNFREK